MELGKHRGRSVSVDWERSLNKHIIITGKSGCGKSVLAQKIMLEITENEGTVLAFDWHQTLAPAQIFPKYENAFKDRMNNVDVYTTGISCPLFTAGLAEKQIQAYALTEILGRVFALGSRQRVTLRQAIEMVYGVQCYQQKGFNALKDALEQLDSETAEILNDKLAPLFLFDIFREGEMFIKQGKINVLRLSCFDTFLQRQILEIVLTYLWFYINIRGLNFPLLSIYIDECQNLPLGNKGILAQYLSEGRKFSIQLLLATQSLSMAYSSADQKRLLQAGTQIFFRPPENENQTIARMLKRENSHELSILLRRLQIGEFLAVGELIFGNQRIEGPIKLNNL